jgi:hypothetical protein
MSSSLFLDFSERAASAPSHRSTSPLVELLQTTKPDTNQDANEPKATLKTGFKDNTTPLSVTSSKLEDIVDDATTQNKDGGDFIVVREPPSKINRWMLDPPFQPNAPAGSIPKCDSPVGILTGLLSPLAIPVAEMLLWDAAAKGLSAAVNAITEHLDAPRANALKAVYDGLIAAVSDMDGALKAWVAFGGRPWTVDERNAFDTLTIVNVKYYRYNLFVSKIQQLSNFRSAKDADDSFGKKWRNITTGAKKEDLQAAINVVSNYKMLTKDASEFVKSFCDAMLKAGLSDFQINVSTASIHLDSAVSSMKDAFPEEIPEFTPVPGRGSDGMQ